MSLTADLFDPRARALRLLVELGDNEEAIAAKLAELGIKGTPCSGENCPVARYLFAEGIYLFGVDAVQMHLPAGHVDVPAAVSEFIEAFDHREFPDLIAPEVSS